MAAITLGFAEVEEQLRSIRRRFNLFALQHVLYLCSSLSVFVVASLILLALLGSASAFRSAFWMALGAVVLGALIGSLTLQHRWMSLDGVARLTDHRAHLEGRLATLFAHRKCGRPSRLAGILLGQVLNLRSGWKLRAIAPRRVPRSIFLLIASLAALSATSLVERPSGPETPKTATRRENPRSGIADALRSGLADRQRLIEDGHGAGNARRIRGEDVMPRNGIDDTGANLPATGSDGYGRAQLHRGHSNLGASISLQPSPADANHDETLPDRLQNLIREAFTAAPLHTQEAAESLGPRARVSTQPGSDGTSQANGNEADSKALPNGRAHKYEGDDDQQHGRQDRKDPHGGSAYGPRAGALSPHAFSSEEDTPGELFATRSMGDERSSDPEAFQLRLTAFSASARTQLEARDTKRAADVTTRGTDSGTARDHRLSERKAPDDPLQRAEISPEHEALLLRIFTRRE